MATARRPGSPDFSDRDTSRATRSPDRRDASAGALEAPAHHEGGAEPADRVWERTFVRGRVDGIPDLIPAEAEPERHPALEDPLVSELAENAHPGADEPEDQGLAVARGVRHARADPETSRRVAPRVIPGADRDPICERIHPGWA